MREPTLINSSWDWGRGDFETGLGAAAHMDRRDIAVYLLENGARLELFAAAMLGNLNIVKATLDTYPGSINTPGPHGIPLIAHAQAGGNEAIQVYEYLKSLSCQKTEARTISVRACFSGDPFQIGVLFFQPSVKIELSCSIQDGSSIVWLSIPNTANRSEPSFKARDSL